MLKVILITQNVELYSMEKLQKKITKRDKVFILSTHKLFFYEQEFINSILPVIGFATFAELLSDVEMEWCDKKAYEIIQKKDGDLTQYYEQIKTLKNEIVFRKLEERYGKNIVGYLCADDLGICEKVWLKNGFKKVSLDYFYKSPQKKENKIRKLLKKSATFKKCYAKYQKFLKLEKAGEIDEITHEVYTAFDGQKKYVFIGNMDRISYRLNMDWEKSEEDYEMLKQRQYDTSDKCQYLSTLHEKDKCRIPDEEKYDVRYIQDGYLPPNYSSQYLKFVPNNVSYYAWDSLGIQIFKNQNISASIIPFRKKLYLPMPVFKKTIKKILVVTSGAGDWTAIKNRSDEDLMVEAIGEIARIMTNVKFVYRCHPVWIHPKHQGVNSINRVAEYFQNLGLLNIKVSSNITHENLNDFKLSLPRQSLDEDLEGTDLVLGEHSIAMIDGAFKGIPFASMNFTGRRNLFCGISDLGFPHFEKISAVIEFVKGISEDKEIQEKYKQAINNYNKMTDIG